MAYIGHYGRDLKARCKDQCRYVTTRSAQARSMHILNNGQDQDPSHSTVELIKPGEKGKKCYCSDSCCIQQFHQRNSLSPNGSRPSSLYSLEHAISDTNGDPAYTQTRRPVKQ